MSGTPSGSPRFPLWARIVVALVIVVLVFLFATGEEDTAVRHFVRQLFRALV